jgi:hypothetical protein
VNILARQIKRKNNNTRMDVQLIPWAINEEEENGGQGGGGGGGM